MDPVTFGLGALCGVVADHVIDGISRRFWSDERKGLYEAHKEQQAQLLRIEFHQKFLEKLDTRLEKLQVRLEGARGAHALRLEEKIADLQKVRDRVEADGPFPAPAPAAPKKAAKRVAAKA